MEKRALLAIALSVGILLIWQAFLTPPAPPPGPVAPAPGIGGGAAPGGPGGAPGVPGGGAPPAGGPVVVRPTEAPAPAGVTAAEVVTPLYRVTFGPDGGVTGWTLRYRGDKPLGVGGAIRPLAVTLTREGQAENVPLRPEATRLELTTAQPRGTLRFSGVARDGRRVERILAFDAGSNEITATLRVEGTTGDPGRSAVALYWTGTVAMPGATRDAAWVTFGEGPEHAQVLGRLLVTAGGPTVTAFEAPSPALRDPKESPGGPALKDPHPVPPAVEATDGGWVALENDYFIAALIAEPGARLFRARATDLAEAAVVFPDVRAELGRPWEGAVRLYVGPKEWERLKQVGAGLEEAQARNYGNLLWIPWLPMWWFCTPLLWLMNYFGTRLPGQNYGVAIILLTVLVKVLFYPLTQKSMTSMKQMQALQPQLNALRSKYRSDPQRFQREQMDLFRKHRVNPMGGCLPMVVQIPIFYALYLTLQYSVELQGAPFLLWITDLSKKDPFYVLPILMGGSMMLQQKMTPTVGDPRQAKIMLFMPVIFTFMFLEFPTGLVLYWLVNNLLSVGQQYLIDRAVARAKAAAVPEGRGEREGKRG
jgi:YidC/Oxa1 family membrane protein insertase